MPRRTVGGWIVFQRRSNGVQNFALNWADFREGFGNLSPEFWLGNEALHNLTNQNAYELRVDVRTKNGQDFYNTYTSFKIENETALYTLRLGSLSGGTIGEVPGRGFSYHNNMAFSTPDRDNDKLSSENCAALDTNGSFWNNKCSYVAPNAVYDNLAWHNGNIARGLVSIEMKLRRRA
ncbi:hypothetical protein RRG08_010128 [Elysia crispata]|uniref:Fibrinogen C-terminal domain-containing protein n=1 Tax=Elysia crispata TaxID=231223 RepID=A0AAE1ASG6_9GAST|nr:hypothetical protein RRG08_010128 [Elysia crispata]